MIGRDTQLARLRADRFDLAVVGGGVSGVAVALEAARRGLRVALVEADDFGQHASYNSLRILHGGLRYLQSLDLPRFFESVGERRWFLRHFPECNRPLECLMPLYGRGLKRPSVMRAALALNDTLSRRRNSGVDPAVHLPRGGILSAQRTRERCGGVPDTGLRGAARWYDGQMTNAPRLLMEMLRWAAHAGAAPANYVRATGVRLGAGRVTGLNVTDRVGGDAFTIDAERVVSCAGQWAARALGDPDAPPAELDRPALAFNLLLDRPAVSDAAVALAPDRGRGRMYFLTPWHGKLLVGTYHRAWAGGSAAAPRPAADDIADFLGELNACLPTLSVTPADVLRVWSGLIPARDPAGDGEAAHRAVVVDHAARGAAGLWTLQAVKYTTARAEARRVLRAAYAGRRPGSEPLTDRPPALAGPWDEAPDSPDALAHAVRTLDTEESVVHLDDLLLRRTDWGVDPRRARALAPAVLDALGWDPARCAAEVERLDAQLATTTPDRDPA